MSEDKTPLPVFIPPPSIDEGDYQPGKALTDEQVEALIAQKAVTKDTLMCRPTAMTYQDWLEVLTTFSSEGKRTALAIEKSIKAKRKEEGKVSEGLKPLGKRQVQYLMKLGLPHLGLPPIEDFVSHNPQVALLAHEELTEAGIGKMCRSPMESRQDGTESTQALARLDNKSMGIADRASFLPKMQEIAAAESSREHLSVQALMEAGIGINDLLLGQVTAMMRQAEEGLESAFSTRGKISPAKLQMLADSVEKLSKAQTRLVDASQKMRGERGIDSSQQTANAIAILVAGMDSGGLQFFAKHRELPPGALLGQPTAMSVEDKTANEESTRKKASGQEPIDVTFEEKKDEDEPKDPPKKRFAVDIVGDA